MLVKLMLLDKKGNALLVEYSKPREEFEAKMLFGDLQYKMFSSEAGIDKNEMCGANN